MYLWTGSPIFDLTGVEALLIRVFHAGKDSSAAEARWVDGTFVMKQHSVCYDLGSSQKFASGQMHVAVCDRFLEKLVFNSHFVML